jgi:ABC-type dipeptide/oligopeptide/nickel transport system permease subunit
MPQSLFDSPTFLESGCLYRYIVIGLAAFFAAVAGHYLVKWTKKLLVDNPVTINEKNAASLGGVERVIYVMAWFLGHPEFIAVWLGAKVVGNWSHYKSSRSEGRGDYSEFLIGTGLSLIVAVIFILLAELLLGVFAPCPRCVYSWL